MGPEQDSPSAAQMQGHAARASGLRIHPLSGVALALLGGAIVWAVIERFEPVFLVPEEFHVKELGAPEEKHLRLRIEQAKVDRRNAALDLALFGAILAGSLGVGEGLSRRSLVPVLIALPVGALFGALSGLCGFAAFELWSTGRLLTSVESAAKVQAAMLAVLGAGSGLALGLSTKSFRIAATATVAGAVGGGLAGLLYPVAASFLLPTAGTELLIPRGELNRLLWIELTAGLLGLVIVAVGRGRIPLGNPHTLLDQLGD